MRVLSTLILICVYVENTIEWSLNPLSWFSRARGCQLKLNSDLNRGHEPVFLAKTRHGFELAMPELVDEIGMFKLAKGDTLFVACPGNNNEIRGFANNNGGSVMSRCVMDKTLELKGKQVVSSELECKDKVFSKLKETEKECGNNIGEEVQLGFEVEGWHPLVTVCYYRSRAETLHASHILFGSSLLGAEIKEKKNYFIKGPSSIYPGVNPASSYKQKNQRKVLSQLLGDERANFILARSYLSRGHLAPDGDFLLGTWQHLAYFYINTAPQWQSINGGNWLKLETLVRNFASSVKQDFIVTTGTYGILELDDVYGYPQKIYLEPLQESIPVPLLLWKIVADPKKSSCIVFVTHNNPFLTEKPSTVCNNICHDHGWPTDLDDVSKGYTYCCSYPEFKGVVDYAPDLDCRSILSNYYV
ncbi:uncharacterized protein LOC124352786 [Homalodisca vitripennis]|nr:uncharacterized protein LOC124352786 [Homalodisca vitripennis]